MRKHDLEELFASVETGDQVEIVDNRDPETAELFGDAQSADASDGTVAAAVPIGPGPAEATPTVAIAAAMPLAR
jgi:hypothetical protein